MKNILLVEPKSPDFNIYTMFKIPRLGLALLGTQALQAGYNVKIIYQETVPLTREHIMWADLVGFSIITPTAPEGYRLARMVRALAQHGQKRKPTTIVFGGVHATFMPEESLKEGDYVIRGEADQIFVPFLNALSQGRSILEIPGLSWKEKDTIVHNPMAKERVDMNSLPTPDWSLFEGYTASIGAVMTSRGCPYDCSFCSVTAMLGRQYRMRSVDKIMQDLSQIRCKKVFFYDDHFTANRKRAKELLRRIIDERGKSHHVEIFSAQVRADIARDPEILDLMKDAGFKHLFIGFESVNPRTLELYNKHQTMEDIENSIVEIHKRSIWIHGMFVFGSDADDEKTFVETVEFAIKNLIETVQFLILTPFPGTRQYADFEVQGRMLNYDWASFDGFNPVYLPKLMSPYKLQMCTIKAMSRFYSIRGILRWLLRGQLWIAVMHVYGLWTLKLWALNNRKRIKALRRDSREVFVPELMRAQCPS